VLRGLALIALAAISWGTTGSVSTVLVARAGAQPFLVGAARMAVAAVLLVVAARAAGARWPGRSALAPSAALGACMAAYQAAYFTAVAMTGIAVTALVAICSAPLMIVLLAAAVLGERPTRRTAVALALGVAGTALLVLEPAGAPAAPARSAAGVLLALVAGLAYALYVVVTKRTLARAAPLPLTAATFTAAAVFMLPLLAWTDAPLGQAARGWPWLLYLGAVATAGAYALYALGLRRVPAAVAGVVTLLEPLTATLLGVLVFGERLGAATVFGALLLVAALGLLAATPESGATRRG
jgi:DME family drug/metabolite transporter